MLSRSTLSPPGPVPVLVRTAAVLAASTLVVLGALLVLQFSSYRSARQVRRAPPSSEAIDGLFVGAAVRFSLVYESVAVGLLVHAAALMALAVRRRLMYGATLLMLLVYGVLAGLVGLRTGAVALVVAASSSLCLAFLFALGSTRRHLARSAAVRVERPAGP